jgi:hypothetical protein
MKTRKVAAALLLAFAPIAVGAPAFAQDDATTKAARARFNEGVEFYDKGQYENARTSFLQAYALRKHPAVLLNLAQSSLRSGHTLEAAKYFQQYLKESTSLTASQRSDAEKGLADARSKLGRIEVSAPTGADIMVDNDHVGTAPLTDLVDVEPGMHTVKANSEAKSITVAGGQQVSAKFGASSGAAVPVPPVSTGTPPGTGDTPPDATQPPADQNATPPPVTADTKRTNLLAPPKTMTPVWVGLGVAVAGGAMAIVFVIFKSNANNSYNNLQNTIKTHKSPAPRPGECTNPSPSFAQACSTLNDDYNAVNTDALLGNIGLGIAIAGVALAGGWYLFAPKRDSGTVTTGQQSSSATTPTLAPMVGLHTTGLSLSGAF